jgi:hypothetical protein
MNFNQERAMCASTFTHLVQNFSGSGAVRAFDGLPDHCPACGGAIEPRRIAAHATSPGDLLLDFVFQCPRAMCRRLFVAEYASVAGDAFTLHAVGGAQAHEDDYHSWAPVYAGRF